jgi:hypothetical protein
MIIAGGAIGLALLALLIGIAYEQLWIPSRPIAQVGSATLSRGEYWRERRNEIARRQAQNLQLLSLFGGQFSSQFEGQIPQLDSQVSAIRTTPVDEETVSGWIERQVILQNAAQLYSIQASDGEVAQTLVGDLGRVFGPPPPPPTSTTTLTPTATLSDTAALGSATTVAAAAIAAPTGTAAPTVQGTPGTTPTQSGPTATSSPTHTPEPTTSPTATPLPDVALKEQDAIIGRLFDSYQQEMLKNPGPTAKLTIEDFKAALRDQYLRQVITTKVEEQLLPEASFTPTTDPSNIEVRQILISTTATLSDTQQQRDAAYAASKPAADAVLQQLRGGADFVSLAMEKSDDFATRDKGGDLPGFDKDGKTQDGKQMDPAIVKAALALKENEISDLIQTPFGWHIIQVVRKTVDTKEAQLQAARTKKFDEWVKERRAAAQIEHYPPQTPSPTQPPTPSPAGLPTVQLVATPTATTVPTGTATLAGPTSPPLTPAATP